MPRAEEKDRVAAVPNYGPLNHYDCARKPLESPMRAQINRLEARLLTMPQVDCPVRHIFASGMYAREMTIPAGTVITGAVHKTQHITILSKGRIQVLREEGVIELTAPATFISSPGTKNAVHVIEEAVWTTFHPNPDDEHDLDVLVPRYITSTNADLLGNRQLAHNPKTALEGG